MNGRDAKIRIDGRKQRQRRDREREYGQEREFIVVRHEGGDCTGVNRAAERSHGIFDRRLQ